MVEKNVIDRNKKYMFQFPEDIDSEKQAEYLDKLSKKLKTDRFVAIDPKIKIFPAAESSSEEKSSDGDKPSDKPPEKDDAKGDKDVDNNDDGKTPENKPVDDGDNKKDDNKDEDVEDVIEDKTVVEKVEVPVKKEEGKTAGLEAVFLDDNFGRHGNDDEK